MKINIVLGDWSDDGHGKTDKVLLEVNKTKVEMQNAYKNSCKTLGVSFNHNDDFTGIEPQNPNRLIAVEYDDSRIPLEAFNILKENGFDLDFINYSDKDFIYIGEREFVELLMRFIRFSLPGFEWEYVKDETEYFNGYWDSNLNIQLGYGLYS